MNTITLQNFTTNVDKDSTFASNNIQDDSVALVKLTKKANVIRYASLDFNGIRLKDESLELADADDNIGYCTAVPCQANGVWPSSTAPKLTIKFGGAYDITKGFAVVQHDNIVDVELRASFYDESGLIETRDYDGYTYDNNQLVVEWETEYERVTKIIVEPTSRYGHRPNQHLKIDRIYFGDSVQFGAIASDINVYSEISLTYDDLPAGTCDVEVQSRIEPEEGQSIIVSTPYFEGKYIIEEVSRKAKDLYVLKCYDDIQQTSDNYVPSGSWSQVGVFGLLKNSPVEWVTEPTDNAMGWFDSGITCRQALAMYQLATKKQILAFNSIDGIYQLNLADKNNIKVIGDDRILGKADYQKKGVYERVVLTYKPQKAEGEEEDPEEERYVVYNTDTLNYNIGSYNFSNSTLLNTLGGDETAKTILKYLNGAEVTASIVYDGESVGDWVQISTPYNGKITGIIKSVELTVGKNSAVARIVVKEAE